MPTTTTLGTQSLCLIQLASPKHTYFIDALEISDLSVLGDLLEKESPTKLIHNASFEREVLGRHGLQINGILDTMVASRERNPNAEGGHSPRAVCARDLNLMIDKTHQTSDWSQHPLSLEQLEYAATDVEVLLALADI